MAKILVYSRPLQRIKDANGKEIPPQGIQVDDADPYYKALTDNRILLIRQEPKANG